MNVVINQITMNRIIGKPHGQMVRNVSVQDINYPNDSQNAIRWANLNLDT